MLKESCTMEHHTHDTHVIHTRYTPARTHAHTCEQQCDAICTVHADHPSSAEDGGVHSDRARHANFVASAQLALVVRPKASRPSLRKERSRWEATRWPAWSGTHQKGQKPANWVVLAWCKEGKGGRWQGNAPGLPSFRGLPRGGSGDGLSAIDATPCTGTGEGNTTSQSFSALDLQSPRGLTASARVLLSLRRVQLAGWSANASWKTCSCQLKIQLAVQFSDSSNPNLPTILTTAILVISSSSFWAQFSSPAVQHTSLPRRGSTTGPRAGGIMLAFIFPEKKLFVNCIEPVRFTLLGSMAEKKLHQPSIQSE